MKLNIPGYLAALTFFFTVNNAIAQDKTATLLPPPPKIAVDGDISEWGDSLRYYDAEKHLNYSIANTQDTLYLAIRFNDRVDQLRVLRAGLTISIDPKGKKKETYSITFPLKTENGLPLSAIRDTGAAESIRQEREELMREKLTSLRGIKAVGFKDIEDEMMTTANTYGIRGAVDYDDNGYLVCEAAIPLQFFHVDDLTKNAWSFNFRINGIERKPQQESNEQDGEGGGHRGGGGGGMGGGGGHRGGRGGGSGGSHSQSNSSQQGELAKTTDFWTRFYLAH
jgi:uncharacterized membrane protein YgcG